MQISGFEVQIFTLFNILFPAVDTMMIVVMFMCFIKVAILTEMFVAVVVFAGIAVEMNMVSAHYCNAQKVN